jgi:hypothetical protein
MSVIVFCGPTIGRDAVAKELDAEVLPPAARGDILTAALNRPSAIGLIDGYFDRVPSVWHKEILWAMAEGIHVFGAASMGALRAAELFSFGMVGVGSIFEGYLTGAMDGDDEVAIAHSDQEYGYRATSDAMVNIRATLHAAHGEAIVSDSTRTQLEGIAKRLMYPDRSYAAMLHAAGEEGLPLRELAALKAWLPAGRVDQKREDALLMLRLLAEQGRQGWSGKRVAYTFAHTDAWEALRREVLSRTKVGEKGVEIELEDALCDELRATGRFGRACDAALARALCLEDARRSNVEMNARAIEAVAEDFRAEQGLLESAQFDRWLETQGVTEDEIVPYFRREATIRRVRARVESELLANLVDHLRATGEFSYVASRSLAKRDALAARGLSFPVLDDADCPEGELWRWYFEDKLKQPMPENLQAYASNERTTVDQLRGSALRELLYGRTII